AQLQRVHLRRLEPAGPEMMLPPISRRQFLAENAMGIGAVALAWLDAQSAAAAPTKLPKDQVHYDLKPKQPHFAPRATAMISLFQHGGPSHVDLFDPKPELTRQSGNDYPGDVQFSFINRASKSLFGSPWQFAKHGECGTEISELLPHLGEIVDDVCL